MTEDKLDKLINSARETYRVPPEPDLEGMWDEIDGELDVRMNGVRRPVARRGFAWPQVGMAAAAALMIGVGVGRWSAPAVSQTGTPTASAELSNAVQQVSYQIPEALQRTATSYLGATAALLRDIQSNPNGTYASQAVDLLSTTRLLLDSPAATDEKLHSLLEDLELILARIAMLNNGPNSRKEDLQMIRTALVDRDVVPRVHTAAVTIGADED